MPAADHGPAARDGPQGERHERADRREDDRRVELLRRPVLRRARPLGPERAGERRRRVVARAREGEHAPALVDGDLADDVRGGAEAVEPEPLRVAGHPQRPVADQAGAQQRRGLAVAEAVRQREAEALVGHRVLGEAAVDVAAREARPHAQVLAPAAAVPACAARPAEPRDAEPLARRLVDADDLMPEHDGRAGSRAPPRPARAGPCGRPRRRGRAAAAAPAPAPGRAARARRSGRPGASRTIASIIATVSRSAGAAAAFEPQPPRTRARPVSAPTCRGGARARRRAAHSAAATSPAPAAACPSGPHTSQAASRRSISRRYRCLAPMAVPVTTTVTELPESRVRVQAEVPAEEVEKRVAQAARELGRTMRVPGFRAGKAPPPSSSSASAATPCSTRRCATRSPPGTAPRSTRPPSCRSASPTSTWATCRARASR